ncbi:branched-chain amino acid ABC transporter permease [Aureimonas fodinaquatilis]|uniref:Branched-chain amino acid ABC transporter permease n=1 Tax=Aureimonas fodinaquatilis TaxID=2565783 RepID=A0A5B0DXX3_9HYPH|nr:branched-chain amino acid ABC transporter permease [Aureimonas fodinaquatilis]KAA0970410.1 branched-chain amino acid ABC transporter permease [Aureimonas fodinaquatilis]
MDFSWDLLLNAVASGIMLGGFYAAVAVGITIAFGMLDIVNIAHPAFIILGSFLAYLSINSMGVDPFFAAMLFAVLGFFFGRYFYRAYYHFFEKRGDDSLQGLAFFFGIMFIVEISLVLIFGVDYRLIDLPYLAKTYEIGFVQIPLRLAAPAVVGVLMVLAIQLYLSKTFTGRAIQAVAQDLEAVRFVGANPIKTKEIAFGIAVGTAIIAGMLLIVIQSVEPSIGREFIGRAFAICVLGGMASLPGTLVAAMILGVAETLTSTFLGPSWSPAVAFGLLLLTLAFRPAGIFGR